MTDPKAPQSSHDDPSEGSPFSHDYLSDSDSEFLAELDRVLETEAEEQRREPEAEDGEQRQEPGPEPRPEPQSEPESDLELESELKQELEQELEPEPEPGPDLELESEQKQAPEQELEPGPDLELEPELEQELENELEFEPESEPGIDVEASADDTPRLAEEVSGLEGADEEIGQMMPPADAAETASAQKAVSDDSPTDEKAPEESPEFWDGEGEVIEPRLNDDEAEELRSLFAGDSEPVEPPATEPDDAAPAAQMEETVVEPAVAAEQIPGPPSAAAPVTEAAGQEPRQDSSSPLWVGVAALLALIGVTVGGVGLWRASGMDERLSRLESASKLAAESVEVTKDPEVGQNAARIDNLEQRLGRELVRLNTDLKGVKSALDERLEQEKARLNQDLSGLNSTLTALQNQLKSAEEMVAQADENLQQKEQEGAQTQSATPQPAKAEPTAAQVKAQPAAKPAKPAAKPKRATAKADAKKAGWAVNLWAFQRRAKAEQELARIRKQGIDAEIFSINSKGKVWHRIAVGGFSSFDEANTYAKSIRSKPGLESAWVGRK